MLTDIKDSLQNLCWELMLLCKPTAPVEISTKSSAYKSKFSREPLGKVMGSKPWVFSNLEGISFK